MWEVCPLPGPRSPACGSMNDTSSVGSFRAPVTTKRAMKSSESSSSLSICERVPRACPRSRPSFAIAKLGRDLGHALGTRSQMDKEELDSLDFIARFVVTGARKEPTLLVSFIDPQAGDLGPGKGHTSHILALFDKADTGYVATY